MGRAALAIADSAVGGAGIEPTTSTSGARGGRPRSTRRCACSSPGRLTIADIRATAEYERRPREMGMADALAEVGDAFAADA